MEQFRKNQLSRLFLLCSANILFFAVALLAILYPVMTASPDASQFVAGFDIGIYAVVQFIFAFLIRRTLSGIKNEETLKKIYELENTGRQNNVDSKACKTGFNVVIFALALGCIAAGMFSRAVFFTLICVLVFTTFVRGLMQYYYNARM